MDNPNVIYLTKDWLPVSKDNPRMVMVKVIGKDGSVKFGIPVEVKKNEQKLFRQTFEDHAGRPGLVGGSVPRGLRALSIGKNKRSRRTDRSDVEYFGRNTIEKREKAVQKEHDRFWGERQKIQEEAERKWKASMDSGERYDSSKIKRDNPIEDYEAVDHSKPYSKGDADFPESHPFSKPENRILAANEAIQQLSYSNMVGYGGALKKAAQGKTEDDLYKLFQTKMKQAGGVTLEDVLKVTYLETQGLLEAYGASEEILLYHGSSSFKGNYEKVYDIGTEFSGFSSWTSDDSAAAGFGTQTLFAPVPRERLLVVPSQIPRQLAGTKGLGFLFGGSRNEHEYIVLSDDFFGRIGLSVKQNQQLFHFGGQGSGNFDHRGRPGMVGGSRGGRMNWSQDEEERVWQWTDTKGQAPVKTLQEISEEKPLSSMEVGDYTKWITGSIDEQNNSDRMQRSGTMFIRQNSTGFITSAGYWMDYPEDFSIREFERYSTLSIEMRAKEEITRQKKHGFEADFKVHFQLAKEGKQGWSNYG